MQRYYAKSSDLSLRLLIRTCKRNDRIADIALDLGSTAVMILDLYGRKTQTRRGLYLNTQVIEDILGRAPASISYAHIACLGVRSRQHGRQWQKCQNPRRMATSRSEVFNGETIFEAFVEDWMFLNTTWRDFTNQNGEYIVEEDEEFHKAQDCETIPTVLSPSPSLSSVTSLTSWPQDELSGLKYDDLDSGSDTSILSGSSSRLRIPRPVSPFGLSSTEQYLFDYFLYVISPQCFLVGSRNPYSSVLTPIALSSPSQPLMQTILAVAANQLRITNDHRFDNDLWIYRAKALSGLRQELEHCKYQHKLKCGWEQSLATVVMLCFFEQEELYKFAIRYLASHDALAGTAWESEDSFEEEQWFFHDPTHQEIIDPLFGSSRELLELIATISNLAGDQARATEIRRWDPATAARLLDRTQTRRDRVERRLHLIEQHAQLPTDAEKSNSISLAEELTRIAEVKRLTTLLYLYTSLDQSLPHHPHMIRLTSKILTMIPRISLRTNTLLWPLFVVGTMGVQPDRDEDRKLILERLNALQKTRQLGNVKKARCVVEGVWKERDLRRTEDTRWRDIIAGRGGLLSLA
ncbi:MAG: hypothetical protein M1834_007836 [Cirrosporium novae-zelandiae]|nr:MAG: hypothetical protein M1834_007836 [Cirrosporium novae-zelandiae]